MAAVSVESLTKVFPNGTKALDGISLSVEDGELFALLGPSGCGKTTLLRILAGLEAPSGGRVRIGSRDVTRTPPAGRNVAMVFQDYALFPHMTVAENIAYPLKVHHVDRTSRRRRAEEVGTGLGLTPLMDRRPGQLSGGQQQRTALARAMAADAALFLFDEPLSNLDARLRMEARTLLKRLHREVRKTTVYVTHDQSEALALADRVAVMDHGRLRQVGPPAEVFHRPANLFVAEFIGSTPMNLLPGRVVPGGVEVAGETVPIRVPALAGWAIGSAGSAGLAGLGGVGLAGSGGAGGSGGSRGSDGWAPASAGPLGAPSAGGPSGTSPADGGSAAGVSAPGPYREVVLAVRPEYVTLLPERVQGSLPAEVEVVEDLGTTYLVTLRGPGATLQAVVPEANAPAPGDQVFVAADWSRASLFDPESGERLELSPVPTERART
jgi:multiple sugar transport system ATP-binding protein